MYGDKFKFQANNINYNIYIVIPNWDFDKKWKEIDCMVHVHITVTLWCLEHEGYYYEHSMLYNSNIHTHTYILQLYLLTKQRVRACYEICLFYLCNIPEQDYQVVLKIHSINLPSK